MHYVDVTAIIPASSNKTCGYGLEYTHCPLWCVKGGDLIAHSIPILSRFTANAINVIFLHYMFVRVRCCT